MDHFRDAILKEKAASDMPGMARIAEALLRLNTPQERAIVNQEARYVGNVSNGGRPSDVMNRAVDHYIEGGPASLTSPMAISMAADAIADGVVTAEG